MRIPDTKNISLVIYEKENLKFLFIVRDILNKYLTVYEAGSSNDLKRDIHVYSKE